MILQRTARVNFRMRFVQSLDEVPDEALKMIALCVPAEEALAAVGMEMPSLDLDDEGSEGDVIKGGFAAAETRGRSNEGA